MCIVFVCL
uniref:Uncharacterized protein n=1 Tax=Anguilla anguilla TaxID=7936 RepID=A0A0E9PDL2_ANGAN